MSQASRLRLQEELERLLGTRKVYFQPPETVKIGYPSIVYERSKINQKFADNKTYKKSEAYKVTYITDNPDDEMIDEIINTFHYCRFDRTYKSNNLYHNVFNIFY